jgi:hypothetical protein
MPLRDHFRSPLNDRRSWDALHGQWPAMLVIALNRRLPASYVAEPRIHLGSFEIDVGTSKDKEAASRADTAESGETGNGGVATALWAPPWPTLSAETDLPNQDEYEILVHEDTRPRRLVAAVEIVSPSNKDRPEHRRAFVGKCADLLRTGVCVSIVDVVTTRQFNLYGDVLELIGQSDPSRASVGPIYSATCRTRPPAAPGSGPARLEAWAHPLAVGQPLPTLPLWIDESRAVPLELESTYEETCRVLRIE